MFETLKNLLVRPSNDFFGPEATENHLSCPITTEEAPDHLILDCNEGIGRVRVIDQMAKAIAESDIRPTWLRHNGSVELTKLRETITMTDEVAKKLLTNEGYVKLSDLHFCDRESLNEWSQREGAQGDWVKCPTCKHDYSEVTFSRALALRIQMGTSFDPKAAKKLFEAPQKVVSIKMYSTLNIPEPENNLKAVKSATCGWNFDSYFWTRTAAMTLLAVAVIGTAYYTGNVPSFSALPLPTL